MSKYLFSGEQSTGIPDTAHFSTFHIIGHCIFITWNGVLNDYELTVIYIGRIVHSLWINHQSY